MERNDVPLALAGGSSPPSEYYQFLNGKWQLKSLSVPRELALTIFINSQELVTILCTPVQLNQLVIGYLFIQNIITNLNDITLMRVCEDDALADVKLKKTDFNLPQKRILTSGCGGGVSFDADLKGHKVVSDLKLNPEKIFQLTRQMLSKALLYNETGGVHTSALCDQNQALVIGEDIGRHNTLDKIMGECVLRKIATRDKILITSGRISSEMLLKAARMEIPLIVSLTSPTERAVSLARELNISIAGYARGNSLIAYANPERLGFSA